MRTYREKPFGEFYGNKVTSNVPFFWIANRCGSANNVLIYNNTLIKAPGAGRFPAVRMGYYRSDATRSNSTDLSQ